MPHNIVSSIPLTDATNPNKFPPYEYHEYPKQMVKKCTKEDVEAWELANKRVDEVTGRASYGMGRPRIGSPVPFYGEDGMPLVVHDAEEEEEFRLEHPDALVITTINQADLLNELEQLRAENARLVAAQQGDPNAKEPGPRHEPNRNLGKGPVDVDDDSADDEGDEPVSGPRLAGLAGKNRPAARPAGKPGLSKLKGK